MSGRTKRGYPFPGMDDADNVPADMKALAEAVDSDVSTAAQEAHHADTVVKSIGITRMETGVHTQPFQGSISYVKTVVFNKPFSAPPVVLVSKTSLSAGTHTVMVSAIDITTTGFSLAFRTIDFNKLNGVSVSANWVAIGS